MDVRSNRTSAIRWAIAAGAVLLAVIGPASSATAATPGSRELISTSGADGGDGPSYTPLVSADGRVVVYTSRATNLGSQDPGSDVDVYWRDRLSNSTSLVSVRFGGLDGGNGPSTMPSVSASGRFVAFMSSAGNLVSPGIDTNGVSDVYWRDMAAGTTRLVSITTAGAAGNQDSGTPTVSADGCIVAFQSRANNLLPGVDAGVDQDVYSRNMCINGPTKLLSVNATNTDGGNGSSTFPKVSADGRYVIFDSYAGDLGAVDSNSTNDVYRRDIQLGTTALVSATTANAAGNGSSFLSSISAHGTVVAFNSFASNLGPTDTNGLADAYARDMTAASAELVTANVANTDAANAATSWSAVSGDGRYVSFHTAASNIHPLDTNAISDTFRRDLATNTTVLVSVNATGTGGGDTISQLSTISADGRFVAFLSVANNLVTPTATGSDFDVFVRDLVWGETTLVSTAGSAVEANAWSGFTFTLGHQLSISNDGRVVAFGSAATDLGPTDPGFDPDVYTAVTAACTINGTSGPDVIFGTSGRDVICGEAGADYLYGIGGDDILDGGVGNDYLDGAGGNDSLSGGDGNDMAIGGSGADSLFGFSDADVLDARDPAVGNEYIEGGLAIDVCHADSGDSRVLCP